MAKGMYIGVDNKARKVKQMYVGADRLLEGLTVRPTTTVNGITFTNNGDGTVSISGTATADTGISIFTDITVVQPYFTKGGTVRFEMKNATYNYPNFNVSLMYTNNGNNYWIPADGISANIPAGSTVMNCDFWIPSGTTVSGKNISFDLRWLSPTTIARKVKKAYIGVNGIARKFFGAELIYKGAITSLRTSRGYLKGASVGEYILFGGGRLGDNYQYSSDVVDAYDSSFVRSNAPALSNGVHHLASASIGKYALFAGGYKGTYSTRSSVVNTYDESLTKGTATTLSSARGTLGATTVGNHALFAGGYPICATVEAYNESLTKSSVTNLSQAREFLAGATNGTHALFAGGQNDGGSTTYSTVDAYDSSLTKVSVASLASVRSKYAGASFGKYAVFDGSWSCEFYDQSLTKVYTDVSHGGYWDGAGVGLNNEYAVFSNCYEVKVYDGSFTRQLFARDDISSDVFGFAAASNRNRAIIAGGNTVNNAVALEIA